MQALNNYYLHEQIGYEYDQALNNLFERLERLNIKMSTVFEKEIDRQFFNTRSAILEVGRNLYKQTPQNKL